jgi:hypothetical protein
MFKIKEREIIDCLRSCVLSSSIFDIAELQFIVVVVIVVVSEARIIVVVFDIGDFYQNWTFDINCNGYTREYVIDR